MTSGIFVHVSDDDGFFREWGAAWPASLSRRYTACSGTHRPETWGQRSRPWPDL